MTATVTGIQITKKYRAALEYDKIDGYYCRLYHTTEKIHPILKVPITVIEAGRHYGRISEKAAFRRYYSQIKRWIKQVK